MLIVIIIGIIFFMFLIRNLYELNNYTITKYTIKSEKVIGNCKFVVLTDLHNCVYGKNNDEIIGAIDHIAPQFVMIIGDMINKNSKDQTNHAFFLISQLALKYKVIYVNGNHEQSYKVQYDEFYNYKAKLEKCGVQFIENNCLSLDHNVVLYGLEIDLQFYKHFSTPDIGEDYISTILGKLNPDKFNILLVHTPNYFNHYSNWKADLTISGHNHGGVIQLPIIGGLLTPQGMLFPKYYAGQYEKGSSKMLVSRGIGSHTFHIRLFNKPEIMELRIENKR